MARDVGLEQTSSTTTKLVRDLKNTLWLKPQNKPLQQNNGNNCSNSKKTPRKEGLSQKRQCTFKLLLKEVSSLA